MSLIPPFEIGIWNAWIFLACIGLALYIPNLIFNRENFKVEGSKSKTEKNFRRPWVALFFLFTIYSIFLPLKVGTIWFIIGLPISLIGLILLTVAIANMATTPLNNKCITKGLYRYSRHPMYLTMFLLLIGLAIASASWVPLAFGIISMVLWQPLAISEEEFCLQKYGDDYREYLESTPRWLGKPGL
jgi:protein-S-isoprenylcysteine O-methyltransferase Ste14